MAAGSRTKLIVGVEGDGERDESLSASLGAVSVLLDTRFRTATS